MDQNDAQFSSLRLWQDRNHDGISQPEEILSLDQAGIAAFALDYKLVGMRDKFGNLFRYRSDVIKSDGSRSFAYDVIFTDRRMNQKVDFWKRVSSSEDLVLK